MPVLVRKLIVFHLKLTVLPSVACHDEGAVNVHLSTCNAAATKVPKVRHCKCEGEEGLLPSSSDHSTHGTTDRKLIPDAASCTTESMKDSEVTTVTSVSASGHPKY
ncbi:hypothetical protein OH76DRAFT_525175 [Lentinus brumalis]|uniref:Secreted protein n=1 Tax=Lentinus brumalis TaxID=2498619 RepID=A0A371CHP4_9APHY|nr:hypothetical protein OH76DRAFT_525175 [Polyporus brumalis]